MKKIQIYDTTLRDGSQGEGISFSLLDKLQITQRLDEIGVDYIEGGYPLSNEKDAEYFREVQNLDLKHSKICAFGMTRRKEIAAKDDIGMQALANSGAPVCTVVGKTWDFHVKEVLRVSLEENLAMISDSVAFLVSLAEKSSTTPSISLTVGKRIQIMLLARLPPPPWPARRLLSVAIPTAALCPKRSCGFWAKSKRLSVPKRLSAFIVIMIAMWRWRIR